MIAWVCYEDCKMCYEGCKIGLMLLSCDLVWLMQFVTVKFWSEKLKTSITSLRRWFGPRNFAWIDKSFSVSFSSVSRSFWQVIRWKRSYGSKLMAVWSLGVKLSKPQRGNQTADHTNRNTTETARLTLTAMTNRKRHKPQWSTKSNRRPHKPQHTETERYRNRNNLNRKIL